MIKVTLFLKNSDSLDWKSNKKFDFDEKLQAGFSDTRISKNVSVVLKKIISGGKLRKIYENGISR